MTQVVVDASVFVACVIAEGRARHTLLTAPRVEFYAPAFIQSEVRSHVPKIIVRSGVAPGVIAALMDDLLNRVTIVPAEAYASKIHVATQLTLAAHAKGDEDYVALALVLDAPIWTYDKDFARVPGIRLISRDQIERGETH